MSLDLRRLKLRHLLTVVEVARGTLFDKRRNLMADWAQFCDTVARTA